MGLTTRKMKKNDDETAKKVKPVTGVCVTDYPYIADNNSNHHFNYVRQSGKEKLPLIIDIHGGAWIYGDKDLNLNYAKWNAQFGYAVALPTYTLAFKATLRDMIQELFAFISYLLENSQSLNFDTDRIYLTGDSAGGHLCTLILACNQSEEMQRIYGVSHLDFDIKACYLCHPVCNLKTMPVVPGNDFVDAHGRDTLLSMLCGKDYKKDGNKLIDYCDINDYIKFLKSMPKTIISSSKGDGFNFSTEITYNLLKKHGVNVTYLYLSDSSFPHVHNVTVPDDKESEFINKNVLNFFK